MSAAFVTSTSSDGAPRQEGILDRGRARRELHQGVAFRTRVNMLPRRGAHALFSLFPVFTSFTSTLAKTIRFTFFGAHFFEGVVEWDLQRLHRNGRVGQLLGLLTTPPSSLPRCAFCCAAWLDQLLFHVSPSRSLCLSFHSAFFKFWDEEDHLAPSASSPSCFTRVV
jgi:hypothetical protein